MVAMATTSRPARIRRNAAYLAVAALMSVAPALLNPASALAATTTSVSSATIVAGHTATLTLRLQDPRTGALVTGATVKLWWRANSSQSWALVGSTTTNSSGVASMTVKPWHNTQYEWTFAGNSHYAPATSAVVTVWVAQAVTITAARTSASTIAIYGTVAPNETGQTVVVQRSVSGSWRTVASAVIKSQVMPSGTTQVGYVVRANVGAATYVFRATRAATTTNVAGFSPTLTVRIS
jgi:hypothetical protein